MMSNKLFFAGLATVALVATSLVGVQSSSAQVSVGGNTATGGSFPGGVNSNASSLGVASGTGTAAVSGSNSFATPLQGNSATSAAAQAGPKVAVGGATSGVVVGPGVGFAQAGANASNNVLGTSFAGSGTAANSIPGFGNAGAVAGFGSAGF